MRSCLAIPNGLLARPGQVCSRGSKPAPQPDGHMQRVRNLKPLADSTPTSAQCCLMVIVQLGLTVLRPSSKAAMTSAGVYLGSRCQKMMSSLTGDSNRPADSAATPDLAAGILKTADGNAAITQARGKNAGQKTSPSMQLSRRYLQGKLAILKNALAAVGFDSPRVE